MSRLEPPELGRRLDLILGAAERMVREIPEDAMDDRLRTDAFRLFRLGLAFADGMDLGRVVPAWGEEAAPGDLRDGAAIARYGALVRGRLAGWFDGASPREFTRVIAVHDGPRSGHEVLERVTADAARRLRVLHAALVAAGRPPRPPLPADALEGLPAVAPLWPSA
ncbi:MAG TPA: hypothetical protein VEH80_11515 [Candidatus Bathyarchaeia archaeon]|nr:hypothetical protein [Candidatus Bathyarchaeia archaeon]